MALDSLARVVLRRWLDSSLRGSLIARRIAKGSLWILAGSALSRVLVLLAMVLVARMLGKISFGELGLVQATVGVAGLMAGIGLGATGTRFVAHFATTEPARAGRVIALVSQTSWLTLLFAVAVLIAASAPIAANALNAPHLRSALVAGAPLMAANVMRGVQSGVVAGLERFDVIAKLNVLEGLVSLVAVGVATHWLGLEGALLGLAIGGLVAWFAGNEALRHSLDERGIAVVHRGCWAEWKVLTGYSLPSLLGSLVATPVLWFCMTLLARHTDGHAELGIYNAAYQWHGPMIFIPLVITSVSLPALVKEWEAGHVERFRTAAVWISGLTLAFALPPALLVGLASPWVMSVYGLDFSEGWPVLVVILAAAPLHALAKVAVAALLGMNKAWIVLGVNLLWGTVMLLLALYLVPSHGAIGLAVSFAAAYGALSASSIAFVLANSRPPSTGERTLLTEAQPGRKPPSTESVIIRR